MLGLGLVGCAHPDRPMMASAPERYYIVEAALHCVIDKHSGPGDRRFYFSYFLEDGEFTAELVRSFTGHKPAVTRRLPISVLDGGVVDKRTGRPAKLWSVKIESIKGDQAVALVTWYSGNLSAGVNKVLLERRHGKWVVQSDKLEMVS
jgi:hypothetical protein